MRNALRLILAGALAAPALALAQASVQLRLDLPVVLPQLVVVTPGVQVVPDVEEEVFFSNGWYWVRQDGGWYRSQSPRAGWILVQPERVPRRIVELPPGQYRRWHPPPPRPGPVRFLGPPAPRPERAYREDDDRGEDHDRDHDRGEGRGHGRGEGHHKGHGHGEREEHRGDRD